MSSVWTKYELPRAAIKSLPALAELYRREGAWRVCLLSRVAAGFAAEAEYSMIKVPALEGTELWLMQRDEQAAVERAAGFAGASEPLLRANGATLMAAISGMILESTTEIVGEGA